MLRQVRPLLLSVSFSTKNSISFSIPQHVRHIGLFTLLRKTIVRDITAGYRVLKIRSQQKYYTKRNLTIPDLFERVAARKGSKPMFVSDDSSYTFAEAQQYVNRVATFFQAQGFKRGDEVALYMENKPEYVLLWLGLSKLGVATALINSNLQDDPLMHCATMVNCKAVIYSPFTAASIEKVYPQLQQKTLRPVRCFTLGEPSGKVPSQNLEELLNQTSPIDIKVPKSVSDPLMYIYTSGTQGLPKAAIISNTKFMCYGVVMRHIVRLRDNDVFYLCLPLYHLSGGVVACSQMIMYGCTGAVVSKFSAKNFWPDCIKFKATVVQYIGEICRYLLNEPVRPEETQHSVNVMYGNGLRPQIWREFQKRFQIPNIRELYGSTEGNCNLINIDNTVGAVGFVPTVARILPGFISKHIYPIKVVKLDDEGRPVRDKNGICEQIREGEIGEIVGYISESNVHKFDGYLDKKATSSKLYSGIFAKGDQGFASSDLLSMDELGYVYFVDRTGDTFRWKGENVSTCEVEALISQMVDNRDAVMFGVPVPGTEGKAGMAVIQDDGTLCLQEFLKKAQGVIPAYALPLFVRLVKEVEQTSTNKMMKSTYIRDGYDLTKVKQDPVYFLDMSKKQYVRVNDELLQEITTGKRRL
ncbi:long-chain fatty acid transport protein 4-like isoform X2 [Varroa jacobsoni]|uniref:Very long-chain fatty acid transport protein n=1 Tax=Varroa destructor TaxID=109461 RepID=A0A7M7JAS2_VARDE|nr:long-chain fatty acid transport protein 4-like isoform X2 [Varroa destructor]XP_022701154.1 long-chain fatty acid transport protein 4-like isoform X2 [Varroa jacobsoni]